MLEAEDIKKLTEYQVEVFKDVFITKDEFHEKIDRLQNSIDVVLKDKLTKDQELTVLNHRMKKAEDALDQIAPKLDVKYEH